NNEKGFVLPVGLIFLAILALLGTTAVIMTTTDLKIGTNYKQSEQALYAAEAGIEEARARFRGSADDLIRIDDGHPTDIGWEAFIGSDIKSQGKGWINGNPLHIKVNSLQSELNYVVTIVHQTVPPGGVSGSVVLYWGDPDGDGISGRNTTVYSGNKNIYLVTAYGYSGASIKIIELEMSRVPPITVPSALYVEALTTVMGASTHIIGTDSCGSDDKPGIVTTNAPGSITYNPSFLLGTNVTGTPDETYSDTNMDVQSIIDSFKGDADFAYSVANATDTGMNWGTPTPGATLQDPSSCGSNNIVYYDTQGTDIKLSGGTSGCGILLVEGDLDMSGGFSWYGIIIVTGSIRYTGGGDKNITGAVISGGSVDADIVGGNSNIVYCSSAIDAQTENRSLRILSWKEEM
ncbi:MAG: pilus assembly PilX N-terminal domain-containing protein, partial [Candidatus Margulisiibacteriota bacterium]